MYDSMLILLVAIYIDNAEVSAVPMTPYDQMTIGVPKETFQSERRVALSPIAVTNLTKQGFNIVIEEGAGLAARFLDEDYISAGAKVKSLKDVYSSSDIIFKV